MPRLTHPILPGSAGGAIIELSIGVSRARENILRRRGHPVPPRISVLALIDTGASPIQSLTHPIVPVSEINLSGQGQVFSALVGRDILALCVFTYDGRAGSFMLEF